MTLGMGSRYIPDSNLGRAARQLGNPGKTHGGEQGGAGPLLAGRRTASAESREIRDAFLDAPLCKTLSYLYEDDGILKGSDRVAR